MRAERKHRPAGEKVAQHGFRVMSFAHRLDSHDAVSAAMRLDDEFPPIAWPLDTGIELCPRCGARNAITALVCARCAAQLPAAGSVRPEAERGPAAVNPERPEPPTASDREFGHDLDRILGEVVAVGSRGGYPASVSAMGDSAESTVPADVRALFDTDTDVDADSRYPILTRVVDDNDPEIALAASATAADRRTRKVVAAAITLLTLVGVGAYFPTLLSIFVAAPTWQSAIGAGGIAAVPVFVAPNNAEPANNVSAPSSQAEAPRPAVAKALPAAAHTLLIRPGTPTDVQAGPLAVSPANQPVDVVTRSKATPSANAAALSTERRDKTRGMMPSAIAAAAVPRAETFEPGRQRSEQFGPCTTTVAALGLCTAPPVQSKE